MSNPPNELAFLAGGGDAGALMRAHDWAVTPLGAPQGWPQALRAAVSIMLNSRYPIALYWGAELALLYNDAWSPIPGSKHPWALGRAGREVWPEIWDTIGPLYERVFTTGEGVWQEDQLLPMNRHGYVEECYFNFTFSPVRGDDGRIDGIFNAVVETTDRVLSERRLRTLSRMGERAETTLSVEAACRWAAGILAENAADAPFALVYVRHGDEARLAAAEGFEESAASAPPVIALDGTAPSVWPLGEVDRSGESLIVDAPAGLDLRRVIWPEPVGQAIITPIRAVGQERPTAFLVTGVNPRREPDAGYRSFFDVAAGHVGNAIAAARAYEEERRRAEALAEIDRAKTTFFSNVSHEFRTPLTLMLGPLEDALAEAETLPPEQRDRLDLAHRNALRLQRLVNALLDFSRIEAGRIQAGFRATDLAALTTDLASSFRAATEKAGLRLVVDAPALSAPVYVDRDMWETIVLNLISNAFKFTFEGEIAVTLREEGGNALLSVRDSGIGIAADELPRLFERFHRVEAAKGRSFEGSGIGLALVHELVRQHHGTIAVESEPGRGTTFTVSIPLGTAHLPAAQVDAASAGKPAGALSRSFVDEALRWLPGADETAREIEADAPTADSAAARQRILVADDNADLRAYIARVLAERGYQVDVAADGEAALAALHARKPDLLVSDVMMPRLDGFGLLAAIRNDETLHDLPVIMLSARAGEEATVEGLEAGADDYLTKPFSARELAARVAGTIAMAAVRREAAEKVAAAEARAARGLADLNATLERRVEERTRELMDAEEALRQAQKMEAMGHLTGGVAHDFNNLLTPIVGTLDILQRRGLGGEREQRLIVGAAQSADRAKILIQRLLAFARRQPLQPIAVDIAALIAGMADLIDSTSGPQIRVVVEVQGDLSSARADPNQLEMALLNLCVNARDAMPEGGTLRISANEVEVGFDTPFKLKPGHYIRLSIADTGVGMDEATLARAVEPFFSTKGVGKGTGLGLSMAHGLASQLRGAMTIQSRPGIGTNVELWLPVSEADAEMPATATNAAPPPPSAGTVLLVDDEALVRMTTAEMLGDLGYDVVEAESGEEALRLIREGLRPQVLVTDHLMAGMNGTALARKLLAEQPPLQVLIVSGYAESEGIEPDLPRLTKPFRKEDLAQRLGNLANSS